MFEYNRYNIKNLNQIYKERCHFLSINLHLTNVGQEMALFDTVLFNIESS